jgi:negative regulator of sigma E activity
LNRLAGEGAERLASLADAPWRRGWMRRMSALALLWCAGGVLSAAAAQGAFGGGSGRPVGPPQRSVDEWLVRLQQGSSVPSFVGTYVVSASNGAMASARIWHLCQGDVQLERVDALSGPPRSSFRRNDEVSLLLPDAHVLRPNSARPAGAFPTCCAPAPTRPRPSTTRPRRRARTAWPAWSPTSWC